MEKKPFLGLTLEKLNHPDMRKAMDDAMNEGNRTYSSPGTLFHYSRSRRRWVRI
tara:strand:- start:613 stop:774 length:162 start_codon:yes stop_codon:yes gene_type:complete